MHGAIATADMQPVPARPFFHKIIQNPVFFEVCLHVLQRFPSKHGNLHICRHKTVPKLIFAMFPSPLSPQTLENAAIYIVFFNFSMLANSNRYTKKSCKHIVFQCFYNVFSRKHRNLDVLRHKVGPKQWFLQCFQGPGIKKRSIPWSSQTLENTAIYTVSFNFSMCQCCWPTQTYVQKIIQKHCFCQCFYMFLNQKSRNWHVFRLKVGPKHWFLQCIQCSGIQKPFKISLFTVFFHFCPFFPCRLKLRPPKIVEKTRKHHLTEVSVRNCF